MIPQQISANDFNQTLQLIESMPWMADKFYRYQQILKRWRVII